MAEKVKRGRGIRARVTAITVAATAVAMAAVVGLSAYASWSSVREVIDRSLIERLDSAEAAVAVGDYARAIDSAGADLLQVIDRSGHIIASTANAQGLAAIAGDDGADEVDDLEIERDNEGANAESATGSADAASGWQSGQAAVSDGEDGSDDLDDDADDDDADDGSDDGSDDQAAYGGYAVGVSGSDDDSDSGTEDDSNSDDGETETDDDDDDDDDDTPHARSYAHASSASGAGRAGIAAVFAPATAFAAEPAADTSAADTASVSASDVLGQPGPFLIMRRAATSPDGPVTLVALTSLAPAIQVAADTAWKIALVLAVLLVLVAVFTWHMTGRTLRPVEQMRREVEAISPTDLDKRITAPEGDRDLAGLAVTFNGLLGRVQAALDEQKRFVSDASHELKSPIAASSLMLEALRACPGEADAQIVDDLAAENGRMDRIVSDLLTLARQDEGRLNAQKRPVDFCDLIFEETASLRRRTAVAVDDAAVEPVVGETDPDLLSHALRNLLDNAARYARAQVGVSCREREGAIEIRVSDDGQGIPPEDRERVFGRFVRLDCDRSRAQGSTGLGLAVTRGIIEQLGGTVRFCDPDLGGATAQVVLPR